MEEKRDRSGLFARLEEQIDQCKVEFEEKKEEAFGGTIAKAKLDMLESLCGSLEKGETPGEMLVRLEKLKEELKESMEREEERPSFYWYDEHYYWKLYCGQSEACQLMIELLKADQG